MQLSKRMEALAQMVSFGGTLADVGTDHGYLPIALVSRGQIASAIAMDLREGPLARARAHVEEAGLSAYIELRLSDGLAALKPGEADTILIAGMGGALMIRILEAHPEAARSAKELILQPQSEIEKVRAYMAETGLCIVREDMVYEDGKFYPMMRAVWGEPYTLGGAELAFGPCLMRERHPVLRAFLVWEQAQCGEILKRLDAAGKERARARRAQVKRRLTLVESVLQEVSDIEIRRFDKGD